jgi:hypothetical protein
MKTPTPLVRRSPSAESCFAEGCFITEWWNTPADAEISVAGARMKRFFNV